jgi:hypothetical protein
VNENVAVPLHVWQDAFETAETLDWDPEAAQWEDGPVCNFIALQYKHHPKVNREPNILEGALRALEEVEFEQVTPALFRTVLDGYVKSTTADFEALVKVHLASQFDLHVSLPGSPTEDDYREWYLHKVADDDVAFGENSSGQAHWFKRHGW